MTTAPALIAHGKPASVHTPRIRELDGLRGIAILSVLAFHFAPHSGPLAWLGRYPARFGWAGVDLFFVLSGFLITGILIDSKGKSGYYTGFIKRRALRIFPLYYICLAGYLLNAYLQGFSLSGAWPFLVYLGNIPQAIQNQAPNLPFFRPLWSLQIEEQFYLAYPLIVALCSIRRLRVALWICIAAALAMRTFSVIYLGENGRLACYVLMPARMDALAMGGLIAITIRNGMLPLRRSWAMLGAGLLGCVALFQFRVPSFRDAGVRSLGFTLIAFTCAALVLVALGSRDKILGAILRWRPLVYMGQISYGVYLLQQPAEAIARPLTARWISIATDGSLQFVIVLGASVALASLSWFAFERPIQRRGQRATRIVAG